MSLVRALKRLTFVSLFLLAVTAASAASMNALTNYRLGGTLITVGDDIAKVKKKLGEPDRVVELKNGFGVYQGERWEYSKYQGKPLHIVVGRDAKTIATIYR